MSSQFRRITAGVAAMGFATAVSFLFAAFVGAGPAPFYAVGSVVVDHAPAAVAEWVIEHFGTDDKQLLFAALGFVLISLGAVAGLAERRTRPLGSATIAGCWMVGGLVALLASAQSDRRVLSASLVAAAAGVAALRLLLGLLRSEEASGEGPSTGLSRRAFGVTLAGLAAASALAAFFTTRLDRIRSVVTERSTMLLPVPANPAPPIPPSALVPTATPYVTRNGDFYRIDTALEVPHVSRDEWRLRIFGMVAEEVVLTWGDLIGMPMVERAVTLSCVSNEIGGDLIGNAVWLGVPMAAILAKAAVAPDADMLLSRSADGWTAGTPLAVVRDGRDAMLAVGMNGDPLPVEHGYPVRQVVPGLYGYVSATKWVTEWEITRFDRAKAYWSTRGWSALGPIKLASRIERPLGVKAVPAGRVVVAGSAWAPHVGISKVEVAVDQGEWQSARLAQEYSVDTWRQWWFDWAAEPGEHTIRCRAYAREGRLQIEKPSPPAPDGATGWHHRRIQVV